MGQSESGPTGATSGTAKERTLKVLFEIELPDDCSCPLSDPDADIENAQNQIDDGVCHAEVTVTDEAGTERVLHSTNQVGDACLCLAFSEVGCVPRTQRVDGDSLFIETYVSDRSVISELVDQLESAAKRVRLRRLTSRQDDATESEPLQSTSPVSRQNSGKQRYSQWTKGTIRRPDRRPSTNSRPRSTSRNPHSLNA